MDTRAVIVDLKPIIGPVQELLNDLEEYSLDMDTVLEMAVSYIEDEGTADEGIEAMAATLMEDAYSFGEPNEEELDKLIKGSVMVGEYLREVFVASGVYDETGSLGRLSFDRYRGPDCCDAVFVSTPTD
ncbi:hypothetical protein PQR34_47980 [Paraburkholderia sediminicola]|uniref:hypothetical protein n=1 Tax=Paraburkholderia sediminicola TaxID=458836 RepID=UPI0038B79F46